MNYQELKNAIIEVIRTNGNEEITGEVLQFVLLEMVSSLGKDFQFAGVATPQTEIIERDDKVAWVLGAGTYENFGIPFTVAVDEIAFVLYNGTYRVQKVKTGVIVDDTLTREGQNPVKGGAIYAEFDKLRAAGYLFAGVATPSLLPPANLTEKIFYLATHGGEYPNLDNITLQKGINIIRFDGTSWIGESLIAITDEVIDSNVSLITAAGVYSGLSGKVDKVEGMGLSQNSYSNTEKSKLGALPTAQELVNMLVGKQDVLTFDTTPTLNSQNPVTSDGIQRAIEAILVLIPSAASALNQLADKSFVNSTVATASATFRGTYNLVSDLSLAVTATHAQIAAALAGAVSGADNNDYCFVQIPTSADTPTEIRVTERYKFNGETWAYEYDLNNSGFTAAQWEAINSAITSALVTKLSNLPDATQLANLFAGKQNTLTFDNAPVSGSSNPVKSGGIYDAIAAITAVIPSTATSSNKLVDLNALTAYVTGIIGALDASFDLTSADGHVTLKMTQVDGVITTLQILTSDIASAQALTTLGGQVSTNADDIAALQALYNALQQSAPEIIQPTDTWPVASPSDTVIYRVIDRVNTPPQYYSDYMFKADDLNTPVLMATYNNAIDAVPTAGSHNLVESGGVQNELALGAVYDVSAKNPTAGPNYDGKFESLAALLSDANLNTLIPDAYRKGGMSIKFVQSSDNKYVQYRCMSQNFTTDVTQWQGVDTEPKVNSKNLINSGGAFKIVERINNLCKIGKAQHIISYVDGSEINIYDSNYNCTDFIDVTDINEIRYSLKGGNVSSALIAAYDGNKDYIQANSVAPDVSYARKSGVWEKGTDTKFVRISFQIVDESDHLAFSQSPFFESDVNDNIVAYIGFQDSSVLNIPTATNSLIGTIRSGDTKYPIWRSILKLYSISSSADSNISAGDIYYNTTNKKLYINRGGGQYDNVPFPFIDAELYLYKDEFYYWNGKELKKYNYLSGDYGAYVSGGSGNIVLDEGDFIQGNINSQTGEISGAVNAITNEKFIVVIPGSTINLSFASGYKLGVSKYGISKNYISKDEWIVTSGDYFISQNCYFIKLTIAGPSGTTVLPDFDDVSLVVTTTDKPIPSRAKPDNATDDIEGYFSDEIPITAPSPQLPANDSDSADFNAETVTSSDIYSAFEELLDGLAQPNGDWYDNPKFGNKSSVVGRDASNTFDINAYVFGKRNRYAWKNADALYAWKNGSTIVYIDSCCPRVGAVIYSDINRTDTGKTVTSYNVANGTFTASDSTVYTRSESDNVAAVVLWSKIAQDKTNPSSIALYNRNDESAGTATAIDLTHLSLNSKTYTRCNDLDYHTAHKGTIVMWGNEHGPHSDPMEPAIILYRMASDIVRGCRNNKFLLYLKENYKIVMIPTANPYGCQYPRVDGRQNYNGININRNYDTVGWSVIADTDKGSEAGDQPETQYIMNACKYFGANLAIDIHCLSFYMSGSQGRCHYEGYIPNTDLNNKVADVMLGYSMSYTSYGNASPSTAAQGSDWIYANGMSGGLIEMYPGPKGNYPQPFYNGKQHTGFIMETDYTLLLNTLRMWLSGIDSSLNLSKVSIK